MRMWLLALALLVSGASAQERAVVVGTCGTMAFVAGETRPVTQNTEGESCVTGAAGGGSGTAADVLEVTMVLDTSALGSGDVMGTTVAVPAAVPVAGGQALLHSVRIHDEDDQGVAFELVIMNANTSLGTANSAPNITDANGRTIVARIPVVTADYYDYGAFKSAVLENLGIELEAAAGQTSLWVSGINGSGTPTFTASGIRLQLGFVYP